MNDNGVERPPSVIREILGQLSDHLDLLSLEWRYESSFAGRRIAVLVGAAFLAFAAFALLQVTLVYLLMKTGLSIGLACLILAAIYGTASAVLGLKTGRRDPKAGAPFEATQRELKSSIQWIQKLLS